MEYFLNVDGEREGPHSQFNIIERIRDGSLTGAESAWHMGLTDWIPLREMDEFTGYWKPTPEQISKAEQLRQETRAEMDRPQPWPRFWARTVDYAWFNSLLWLVIMATFPDAWLTWLVHMLMLGAPVPSVFALLFTVVEAWMLSRRGTTPGKALMRIEVRRSDGKLPGFRQAFVRSMLVCLRGVALCVALPLPLSIFTMSWCRLRLLQNGVTSWDRDTQLRTEHGEADVGRYWSAAGLIILNVLALNFFMESSAAIQTGVHEAMKEVLKSLHM